MTSGMHAGSGRAISNIDHIRQSITDILTTPLGSRVMRRSYGSLLPELIDHPDNPANRLRLIAASAVALMTWEPRIRLSRINIDHADAAGALTVTIEASGAARNERLNMVIALKSGAA